MNLQSFKDTPDSQNLRFKGSERKLPLGAPATSKFNFCNKLTKPFNMAKFEKIEVFYLAWV